MKKVWSRLKAYFYKPQVQQTLVDLLRTIVSLLIALAIGIVIILITSKEPANTIKTLLFAPLQDDFTFGMVITQTVPLIFTGIAVTIMVRGGQFNMIGEGAFFAGAFIGAVLSAKLNWPWFLGPLIAMLFASLVMGIVGYVPAKLKASLAVDEFVSSLMLNFVIFWVVMYLFNNVFFDPDYSNLATPYLEDHQKLPFLNVDNEVSIGIILALILTVLTYLFLYHTKWGYAVRMTGDNPKYAKYLGMNVKRIVIVVQILGAMIAAFGGATFLLGNSYRFTWKALPNYGFDGFVVAILAFNHPLLVPFAALLLGYLRVGAAEMARLSDVPNEIVYIIQALIILFVGGQAFFVRLKRKRLEKALEFSSCKEAEEKGDA
ncbi:MAG: Branched-chain amino acid transport system / permease component [Tenericutes bacterium ADurb.Bin087]|nr:MAG: Branched-chain amino acid transport system / permease component [Tenericutes bacterium ADurb.Bin087]